MGRKWYNGIFGVKEATTASEFTPKSYRARVYGLGRFGLPQIPVVGRVSYRKLDEPSPWHGHRGCIELVYCASGTSEYESDGQVFRLSTGTMFVSRPHEVHRQLVCPKGYASYYLHFRPASDSVSRWLAARLAEIPRLIVCGRSVAARFSRILALAAGDRPRDELRVRLGTECRALLLDVIDSATMPTRQRVPEAIGDIAARIRKNPSQSYPLSGLVASSGVSKATCIALFKRAYGYAPHAYLLLQRVEAAKKLLLRGAAVKDVAARTGFLSSQQFTRTFRNFTGCSPSRWIAERLR